MKFVVPFLVLFLSLVVLIQSENSPSVKKVHNRASWKSSKQGQIEENDELVNNDENLLEVIKKSLTGYAKAMKQYDKQALVLNKVRICTTSLTNFVKKQKSIIDKTFHQEISQHTK